MTLTGVFFDPTAPSGSKFPSTAVRDEIGEVAPQTIDPGAITEPMYATGSVSNRALAAGSVSTAKYVAQSVTTPVLADLGVTTPKLGNGAVTGPKAGTGTVTAKDKDGNYRALSEVILTDVEYDAIQNPDPNVLYFVYWD